MATPKLYIRNAANDGWTVIPWGGGGGSGSATGDYIPEDGWVAISDTLTYASATTFTVTGDLTATFQKGTKLKLTQTNVKYFYVVSSAYVDPTTTVTVTGGDDYALINAAITTPYYSYIENPQAFPDWFNYTPALTASGSMTVSSPTITMAKFKVMGHQVFCNIRCTFTLGGSSANTINATVPIECAANQSSGQATCLSGSVSEVGYVIYGYGTPGDYFMVRRGDGGAWATGAGKLFTLSINYEME